MGKKSRNRLIPEPKRRIRVLAWIDSPACATGFATVARGIFNYLASTNKYDIDIIGINDAGDWKDPIKHPYRIYPARPSLSDSMTDYYGRPRFISAILGQDWALKPPWDIIFTLNDPFILEQPLEIFKKGTMLIIKDTQTLFREKLPKDYWFKIISYWPVDSMIMANWTEKAVALADTSVAYTKYGYDEIIKSDIDCLEPTHIKDRLRIIYHGVNTNIFKPLEPKVIRKFKEKFFNGKVKENTFLVAAIARNQPRKDLPRTLQIFAEFVKRRPDSFLYLHCKDSDVWGSLKEYARNFRSLEYGKNWAVPAGFEPNKGFPVEAVNLIYNSADCILSTSLGEGFGFYNLEGFATKTLVIAPNNTTHPELFNYDVKEDISDMNTIYQKLRGVPMKCYSNSSEWATYGPTDYQRIRPLTNIEDAVKKLIWVYDNPDKAREIEERAYTWVQDYDWAKISREWDKLFEEVYKELEDERSKAPDNPVEALGPEPSITERAKPDKPAEAKGEHQEDAPLPSPDSPPQG